MSESFEVLRRFMVSSQLRTTGVSDARVIAAMAEVPREQFVPAERRALAYLDIAVPLAGSRALPAPMVLGRLLTEARLATRDRLLVIGSASGYAAAVAARITGHVVALEEDAGIPRGPLPETVEQVSGPLAEGWPAGAPYDVILFDGAIEQVPDTIVAQLAEGGRIAAPLVVNDVVRLAIGRKAGGSFGTTSFIDAAAPALPGFARAVAFAF